MVLTTGKFLKNLIEINEMFYAGELSDACEKIAMFDAKTSTAIIFASIVIFIIGFFAIIMLQGGGEKIKKMVFKEKPEKNNIVNNYNNCIFINDDAFEGKESKNAEITITYHIAIEIVGTGLEEKGKTNDKKICRCKPKRKSKRSNRSKK